MSEFLPIYAEEKFPSSWSAYFTGWWFGFSGNVGGNAVCTAYAIGRANPVSLPILGGSWNTYLNTKNVGYAYAVGDFAEGNKYELSYASQYPRLEYQGVRLSEDVVSPWVNIQSSFRQSVAIAEDGELYAGGWDLLSWIDPEYVALPSPEVTGSSDDVVATETRAERISELANVVNNFGANRMFRICTEPTYNEKWTHCDVARGGGSPTLSPLPFFVAALSTAGTAFAAGASLNGHFGTNGTHVSVLSPINTHTYKQISASENRVLAITEDNILHAWGNTRSATQDFVDTDGNGVYSSECGAGQTVSTTSLTPITIKGVVKNITVTNAGSGYTAAPIVTFTPSVTPENTARALASVVSGEVANIVITEGGVGYTAAPTITLGPPPGGGTQATAECEIAENFVYCHAADTGSAVIDEDGVAFQTLGLFVSTTIPSTSVKGVYSFAQAVTPKTISNVYTGGKGQFSATFFIADDGTLYAQGRNNVGQLGFTNPGFPAPTDYYTPQPAGTLYNWKQAVTDKASGSPELSVGLRDNGELYVWGNLQDISEYTQNNSSVPLQLGPVDDRWKTISKMDSPAPTTVIRDDDASPDVDYG